MTEKEYRQLSAVSYSSLSELAVSPQSYKANLESERKESSEMILGSVVDMLLTQPDRFDEEVYVMTAVKPTVETMLTYCTKLAESGNTAIAYGASGYKISPDAVFKKFEKDGKAYYDALMAARGKMIIDADDMFTANQIVKQLLNNPFTKDYFLSDSEDVEIVFQYISKWKIYFVPMEGGPLKEMDAKSMIDIVRIDHKNKIITPIDLKTGAEGFFRSYWRFKRYLQGSMYTDAIEFSQSNYGWKDNRLEGYTLAPLKFIYADTNLIHAPMVYSSTQVDIIGGREGIDYLVPVAGLAKSFESSEIHKIDTIGFGPSYINKTKGYAQLVAELDWHQRNDIWDYTYEDYQNKGERQINAFDIKL